MKEAHKAMVNKFKSNATIVFDPNVRLPLWQNVKHVKKQYMNFTES